MKPYMLRIEYHDKRAEHRYYSNNRSMRRSREKYLKDPKVKRVYIFKLIEHAEQLELPF